MKTITRGLIKQVCDYYPKQGEFAELLTVAKECAATRWEEEFVRSVKEKFFLFGDRLYWTKKQDESLLRIAGRMADVRS